MIDGRRRERHTLSKHVLCYKCDQIQGYHVKAPFMIEIHDISYGGLGIYTDNRLYKDLHLYFRLDTDGDIREFKVKVMWSKYEDEHYSSGVQFVDVVKEDIIFLHKIVHPLE